MIALNNSARVGPLLSVEESNGLVSQQWLQSADESELFLDAKANCAVIIGPNARQVHFARHHHGQNAADGGACLLQRREITRPAEQQIAYRDSAAIPDAERLQKPDRIGKPGAALKGNRSVLSGYVPADLLGCESHSRTPRHDRLSHKAQFPAGFSPTRKQCSNWAWSWPKTPELLLIDEAVCRHDAARIGTHRRIGSWPWPASTP